MRKRFKMRRGATSVRHHLVTGVLIAGLLPLILGIGVVAWRSSADSADRSQTLAQEKADAGAAALSRMLHDLRYQLLLAANDSALRQWYTDRASQPALRPVIEDSLVLLNQLQPDLIDEACFIDRNGPELARMVKGKAASISDLSPDESGNPFFQPTFAKAPGEVYQGSPYISPDSGRWVIPTATVISVDNRPVALLHFEVSLEGIRDQIAATLGDGVAFRVVDAATDTVVMDGLDAQPIVDAPFAPAGTGWAGRRAVAPAALTGVQDGLEGWTLDVGLAKQSSFGSDELVALGALLFVTLLVLWFWARRVASGIV